ncbi:Reverse transcriptase RNA-dependent DNA polymerase [Arabidopsis suecica]|uniref:Reverse transcriptase RNA-dependent DNA polymerase n=1 Tax=Arabidopsis suecica TaxID=45249 RepID=A0A8T2FCH7_ARASU|nr:Reverse transcriptase RNA-dependent DNA polymerase [Arabidopsis suecica]
MQENKKIDENIDDFLKIVADLNHLQIEVSDEVQAILLLSSLPARYDGLVETMKYSNSREKLRLDDVMVASRDKERKLSQNNRPVAEGHYVRGRSDGKNNNQGKKGQNRSRSKSADGKRVCWICGKEGHFKKQCYKWIERNKTKQQGSDVGESSLAKSEETFDPAMVLMATGETLLVSGRDAEEWVLDTGCTFHMTPRRDLFRDFKELSSGFVKMGNDTYSLVKGIGSQKRETLYILEGVAENGESYASVESKDETSLWVSRLGHMSQKRMEILVKKGCLQKEAIKELKFCEDCVYGKNYRKKDEAFEKFVEWKKMVKNQSDKKVKKLITDNGLEYCNHYFEKFCKDEGIVRHKTCAYTPQQNGIVERLNRTIMDKVRSMLSESGMDKKFWAEAASTAVYLINRSPSTALEFDLPEEKWTGALPDLKGLRKFGCLVYIHADQGKLNPRAKKGVFTSYPEGVKGYKVWVLDERKCVISRSVIFREEVMFKDLQNDSHTGMIESDLENIRINPPVVFSDQEITDQGGATLIEADQNDTNQDGSPMNSQNQVQNENQTQEENSSESEEEDLSDYQLVRDGAKRAVKSNPKYNESNLVGFAFFTEDGDHAEPDSYQQALNDPEWDKWNEAMKEEMMSMRKNQTWDLVDKPEGIKIIGCRWIFTRKAGIPGVEAPRYKARLVAKGFTQKEGIDYTEIFSPVVKHVSIRYILSMVAHFNMELQQMDVKTAFLHGFLEEDIYMAQPEGFEDKKNPEKVCYLKRSLYGLKQCPRQWNLRFDEFMKGIGFERSAFDSCVYYKKLGKTYTYLLLYVDDMLIASVDKSSVQELKLLLNREFEMKDLGDAKKILGMEITRDREAGILSLSQEAYVKKVLRSTHMDQSKPVSTPIGVHFKLKAATDEEYKNQFERMKFVPYANTVGSIMYSMIGTRPDLAYPLGVITGGNTISWKSKLLKVVALSTTEAEYMALTEAVKEALWLKGLANELGFPQRYVEVHCDSQSAIALAKNSVHHENTKHIDIRLHFIRDVRAEGKIRLVKIDDIRMGADIVADGLTDGPPDRLADEPAEGLSDRFSEGLSEEPADKLVDKLNLTKEPPDVLEDFLLFIFTLMNTTRHLGAAEMTHILFIHPKPREKKLSLIGESLAFSLKIEYPPLDPVRLLTLEDLSHPSHPPDLRRFLKITPQAKGASLLMPNG